MATFNYQEAMQLVRTESHDMDVVKEQAISLVRNTQGVDIKQPNAALVLDQLYMQFTQLMVAAAELDLTLDNKMEQLVVLTNFQNSQAEGCQLMMGYFRSLEGWALLSADLAHVSQAALRQGLDLLRQEPNNNAAGMPAYHVPDSERYFHSLIGAVDLFKQLIIEQLLTPAVWAAAASVNSDEIRNAAPALIKLGGDLLREKPRIVTLPLRNAASQRRKLKLGTTVSKSQATSSA